MQSNLGKTHAIHTWLSRPIWYCREPRIHDNDTGDVARGQRWSTPCMHGVRKAEYLLLGPKCPVGAVKEHTYYLYLVGTQSTLGSPGQFVLPRAAKKHDNDTGDIARCQRRFTPCMHCVRKAEISLLGPECPVGAVQPRQNTRNPDLALQAHLVLPRAAKT